MKFVLERSGSCLFLEQRVGKTYVVLGVVEQLITPSFAALIVVPKTNKNTTWTKQLGANLPQVNVADEWGAFKKLPFPKVFVCHYEGLPEKMRPLVNFKWSLVVYDESQRLKARNSLASRRSRMLRFAERRVILSGTPLDKTPLDLWAQMRFAAPWVFGDNWGEFVTEYCQTYGYMGTKVKLTKDGHERFMKKLEPHCIRVTKEDLGHVPPIIHHVGFELLGAQGRLYREIEDQMWAELPFQRRVTTGLRITQMAKLQQITSGFVIDDDGEITIVGRAKLRKLRAVLLRLDAPIVIFCKYKVDIAQVVELCHELFPRVGIIYSKVKQRERDEIQRQFQAGELDALVCQIKTGGVGLDLYRGRYGVVYSSTFSFIDFEQAVARLDLIGQPDPVEIFLLNANRSIDEDIAAAITSKRSVSETTLNRLKRRSST